MGSQVSPTTQILVLVQEDRRMGSQVNEKKKKRRRRENERKKKKKGEGKEKETLKKMSL
jgi:hypothetical protein